MLLECRCGHFKLVLVKELIGRFSSTTKIYEVARKAKCSATRTKNGIYMKASKLQELAERVPQEIGSTHFLGLLLNLNISGLGSRRIIEVNIPFANVFRFG